MQLKHSLAAGLPATLTTGSERQPRPAGSWDLQRQVSPTTAGEVFAHPHHPCTTVPYYWTATGLTKGRKQTTQSVEVSKHRQRDSI